MILINDFFSFSNEQNYKNIRESIPDFYAIFPDIKAQVDLLLIQDNNADYIENPWVDIEAIAKKVGNGVFIAPPQVFQNDERSLLISGTIFLNENDSEAERRFSIAHEIAHFVLKGKNSKNMPDVVARTVEKQWESLRKQVKNNDNIKRIIELAVDEELADYFAANLLVPAERFIVWEKNPDEEIAQAFGVSVTCIQKRRLEIKSEMSFIEHSSDLKHYLINKSIEIPRGTVVGIGKVKIPKTQEFNYEIQLLSFLVIQKSESSFVSTCIHLRIDGYGQTIEEAEEDMVENVCYFLCKNFSDLSLEDAWENLKQLFMSDKRSNELWDAYHKVQIELSINGIPTDNTVNLLRRLEYLEERVKELETRVKNEDPQETYARVIIKISKFPKVLIVEKIHFKAKAA